MSYDWISFTTDYGIDDGFVGACEGVMARIAPGARVLHLSHTVPARDVRRGAAILAQAVPYLPPAVHLAVVDPGVGTDRRGIVLVAAEGLLVGPDNGLLVPAAEMLGEVRAAYELTEPAYQLSTVSATFHGRDVFAPVAAHLALGAALAEAGEPIEPGSLVSLELPQPTIEADRILAHALHADRFGNVALDLTAEAATGGPLAPGERLEVRAPDGRFEAVWAGTFAEVERGDLLLHEDSSRRLALSVNGGSAAGLLDLDPDDEVELRPL